MGHNKNEHKPSFTSKNKIATKMNSPAKKENEKATKVSQISFKRRQIFAP